MKNVKTQWDMGVCPECKLPIQGGKVVNVKERGGQMHFDCFKCSACEKQLTKKPYRVETDALICDPCWKVAHPPEEKKAAPAAPAAAAAAAAPAAPAAKAGAGGKKK